MLTKLAKKYGTHYSVGMYIELGAQELGLSENVVKKAHELNSGYSNMRSAVKSMQACALLYDATIHTGETIYSKNWSRICTYDTLKKHARWMRP